LNDGCLMVYDFQGKEISKLSQKQEVTCVQMKENFIISGSKDKKISVWKDFKLQRELIGHSAKITKVVFDVDDKIVSSSFDNTVILWDFKSMDVIATFDQSMGAVTDLLLTPNYIIASSLDYTAFCVDYRLKKEYPFNLEAPDYDLDSQAYLKPPTDTWGKIEPHERKEIEKIEILKDHEVKGAFILLNLFSEVECEHYIKETESIGYEPLLGYDPKYRSNKRIIITDFGLSKVLFERIKSHLPQIWIDELTGKKWKLKELNERFRFCRYFENQHFSAHYDGDFQKCPSQKSFFTFMIYLNGPLEGGSTNFLESPKNKENILLEVKPIAGLTLLFPHHMYHEGEKLKKGVKYICRSDVVYELI
jgi:hypothetical protein